MLIGGIPAIRRVTKQLEAETPDTKVRAFVRGVVAQAAAAAIQFGTLEKTEAKQLEGLGERMLKLSEVSGLSKMWHAICFCIQYICAKSLIKSIPDRLMRVQCGILDNFHMQGRQICNEFGITTEKFQDQFSNLLGGEKNKELKISQQLYLDLYRKGFDLVVEGVAQHCQLAQLPEGASSSESESDLPASLSSTAEDLDRILEVMDDVTEDRILSNKILHLINQGMCAHMVATSEVIALEEGLCFASGPQALQLQKTVDGVRCTLSWSPIIAEREGPQQYGKIELSNSFLFKQDGSIQVENFRLKIEDVVATIRDL